MADKLTNPRGTADILPNETPLIGSNADQECSDDSIVQGKLNVIIKKRFAVCEREHSSKHKIYKIILEDMLQRAH